MELTDPRTAVSSEPENLPEVIGRAWGRYALPADPWVNGEAEYTGPQFCLDPDTGADVELDAGTWLNATIGKVWPGLGGDRRLETSISGTNLADTSLYDQCGLTRAGRLLRFQVRMF